MPFAGGDKGDMDLENLPSGFNKALLQTEPKYQSPELLLVNGGSEPVISMKKNQWRFRRADVPRTGRAAAAAGT